MDEREVGEPGSGDANFDDGTFRERQVEEAGSHHERTGRGLRGIRGYAARAERALEEPRARQLLLVIAPVILATLLMLGIWQDSGTRGAKRDFASARERVLEKEREVAAARRILAQRLAELRVVSAEADVEATKLGGPVEQNLGDAIDDERLVGPPIGPSLQPTIGSTPGAPTNVGAPDESAAQVYYVRDEQGRFVPVSRP